MKNLWRDVRYLPGEAMRRAGVAFRLRSSLASARSILAGFHYYHVLSRHVDQPAALLDLRTGKLNRTPHASTRHALKEIVDDVAFSLSRQALEDLPQAYVEEFRSLYESVQVSDPGKKEFHVAFLSDIETRMIIARYVEEGSRLRFYQHAAGYGEVCGHVLHHAEGQLADRFRTWGWSLRENDEPYLALRLMKPPRLSFRAKSSAGSWLFVIVRPPVPRLIERTHATQRSFFGTLRDELAAKIVVRPRTDVGSLGDSQILDEVRSKVRAIDDGASRMVDLVRDVELVILDMLPSTVFMECAATDTPVIAIVPEETVFTATAARFYDEFLNTGLLHRSAEAAAAFLNQLNVRAWWQDVRRMDSFRDYLNIFCNRDAARLGSDFKRGGRERSI
jgi:putative transferase (TIGR04331 family)